MLTQKLLVIKQWLPGFALLLMIVFSSIGSAAAEMSFEAQHKPPEARYRSAQDCARCHSGIHRVWSQSMHALAATDPMFQRSLAAAVENYGEETRAYCVSCHSPTTQITSDLHLQNAISREGVTCDFCHTATGVIENSPQNFFRMQLGDTRFGPMENLKPVSGLEFQYSALHTSAELCQGCHELKSPQGVTVLGTYSEWKESSYARGGIECRNCHMPEMIDVPSVDPQVRPASPPSHAHEFLGGHSQIRLEKAASLKLNSRSEGGKILVDAYVTNEEAGHSLPTGIPVRRMILTVSLKDGSGKVIESRTREYRKTVVDSKGAALDQPEKILLEAAAIRSDNRIKPKETRRENFEFSGLSGRGPFIVDADLKYHFQTVVDPASVTTTMVSASNTVTIPAGSGPFSWSVLIAATLILAAILWIVFTSISRNKGR